MKLVDYDLFLEWAIDRFGEENIKFYKDEICIPSFFAEAAGIPDPKHHLWMNPLGGKKQREHGVYRCWYTDARGSLVSLVSKVDSITFEEAEEVIGATISLRMLEKKVHEFFGHKEDVVVEILEEPEPEGIQFPDFTYCIDKMEVSHFMRNRVKSYLDSRKLPSEGLYVCTEDNKYGNRLIIPYYDRKGKLIYWSGRTLNNKNKKIARYMKCEGVDQNDVLYFKKWPFRGKKIYITEGELDALTLTMCGFHGCAVGGKFISDNQIEMLRGYQPVLAFDSDKTGEEAMIAVGDRLLERGFLGIKYIRPPKVYKDWNKLLQKRNSATIRAYIQRFEKTYNFDTSSLLLAQKL